MAIDSVAISEDADVEWFASLRPRPTIDWQQYLEKGKRILLRDYRIIDVYGEGKSETAILWSGDVIVRAACDVECRDLYETTRWSSNLSYVFVVDSVFATITLPAFVDNIHSVDDFELTVDFPHITRVLEGRLSSVIDTE